MSQKQIQFSNHGPFDFEERALIVEVDAAMQASTGAEDLIAQVRHNVALLDQLGEVLCSYPSLFATQSLGRRQRDLSSLVNMLSHSNLSNFEMSLPTRALIGRNLIMGEMNFYRLLRFVCKDALSETLAEKLIIKIDRLLCRCVYTRLAEELLTHIASDAQIAQSEREKSVLALTQIWERVTYRISDFFPVLQATWEARRGIEITGGTLLGTAEMFQLLGRGCDERFVDLLVRPEHSDDEAAAFREFLFGATTEQLQRLQEGMTASGRHTVSVEDLSSVCRNAELNTMGADPALAMFEFFLSRHLQAAARRQAELAGPKRTAEEYVLLHYLETQDKEALSAAPPSSGSTR